MVIMFVLMMWIETFIRYSQRSEMRMIMFVLMMWIETFIRYSQRMKIGKSKYYSLE